MQEVEEKAKALWSADYKMKMAAYQELMNTPPDEKWIKSLAGGILYLPIGVIEQLLSIIYGRFRYEVLSYENNGEVVTASVRVHIFNPVFEEWEFVDGVGGSPLDKSQGSMALALALPAAKTFAVKDAVEPLGKIFGKDLNRADQISYDGMKPDTDYTKLFVPALKDYKGKDKAELQKEMMDAVKNGWTNELVEKLHKKLGV